MTQNRRQPLFRRDFRRQAELLSPCRAHSGRNLHHRHRVRIVQRFEYLVRIVALTKRRHRAMRDALAAQRAIRRLNLASVGDVDGRAAARAHHVPHAEILHLVADLNAAHALDALRVVADQRKIHVPTACLRLFAVRIADAAHVVGQLLKRTVAAPHADRAAAVMLGENQLHIRPTRLTHAGRVGMDDHALRHRIVAGGQQALMPVHLHQTHAARRDFVDILQIAQPRNAHADRRRRVHDGGVFFYAHAHAVDCHVYHIAALPPLKMPYP